MNTTIMQRSATNDRTVLHSALFITMLIALHLAIIGLLPDSYMELLRRMTGWAAASLLLPFGVSTFDGTLLTTNGFVMQIAVECTAMHILTIFLAGVIAYPHHGATYKLVGITAGTAVLLSMNVFRIAVLGLVGAYAPQYFDFLHVYLWEGVFALLIVVVWVIWVRKPGVDMLLVIKMGTALVVSAAGVGILSVAMPAYLDALIFVAGPIAGLLFEHGPSSMSASGELITLNFGSMSVSAGMISTNAYNQVIFASLMATTFMQGGGFAAVRRIVYGLGVFFLLLLGHVMLFIMGIIHNVPVAWMVVLDVSVRTISLSLCIGLYLIYARKLRASRKNTSDREGGKINEKMVIAY